MDLADRRGLETDVYQPAEDSHLLADVACAHIAPSSLVLEVGTGSGYVADRLAREAGARVVAADINPNAVEAARARARYGLEGAADTDASADTDDGEHRDEREDGQPRGTLSSRRSGPYGVEPSAFEVVRADLVSPFATDAFDAVVFNPPYLPTDPDHEWDDWMERALSGGADGRAVIDPFLEAVPRVLADDGVVYLLVSSLTGVDAVAEQAGVAGFSAVALADKSFPYETLTILKLRQ